MNKLAVLGYGYWGPNQVRNFCRLLGEERVVVCEPEPVRRVLARERHPGVCLTTCAQEVLADPEIEAVSLCVPAGLHFELAWQCLQAGRHVLVEKPLATSSADGQALVELAERQGRVLMAGDVYLYHPAVRALRRLIAEGTLGDVRYVNCIRSSLGPRVRDEVSVVWDYLIHNAYIVPHLVGSEPKVVRAAGGCWLHRGVADVCFVELFFDGSTVAHLQSSWYYPVKERRMVVVGSERMAVWDEEMDPTLTLHERGYARQEGVDGRGNRGLRLYDQGARAVELEPTEPLYAECRHFLECIATGQEPVSDGRRALKTLRLLEAVDRSLEAQGCLIPVALLPAQPAWEVDPPKDWSPGQPARAGSLRDWTSLTVQ